MFSFQNIQIFDCAFSEYSNLNICDAIIDINTVN